jgi:hydrogenase maturation factor HypF (carbamoyltransferase family)
MNKRIRLRMRAEAEVTPAAGFESAGFEVFIHSRVPPNPGRLALGQPAIDAAVLRRN